MTVTCLGLWGKTIKKVDTLGRYTPWSFFSSCTAGLEYSGGSWGSKSHPGP